MSVFGQSAWNRASTIYQRKQQLSTKQVHYGPWSPSEEELHLLGDLRGKHVLDLGCGGGQNCIAMVRQGATVTGVDFSETQLRYAELLVAQQLAPALAQQLRFVHHDAEHLAEVASATIDLVVSVNTLQYVGDVARALHECERVLGEEGRLIFTTDHPLRSCFVDEEADELAIYPIRSYFNDEPMRWQFPESGAWMVSYHHTLAQWVELLADAGFQLQRLLEPPPPADLADELWPLDGPLAEMRHIPQTMIVVAKKS
ncbi:MAG: class I SAM-dependent methyltransferase [Caldilineaceae bacterium]